MQEARTSAPNTAEAFRNHGPSSFVRSGPRTNATKKPIMKITADTQSKILLRLLASAHPVGLSALHSCVLKRGTI